MLTLSLIKAAAIQMGVSCPELFITLALRANPKNDEARSLELFARAACESLYVDELWAIANTESSFRFAIASVNQSGRTVKNFKGKEAIGLLSIAERNKRRGVKLHKNLPNTDFGVLQINFQAHAIEPPFRDNPALIISPTAQVSYVTQTFIPWLKAKCPKNWIGCYHSPGNKTLQKKYMERVNKSKNTMKRFIADEKKSAIENSRKIADLRR